MLKIDFETSLELKQIDTDTFETIQPAWTWHNTTVVPGGLLMSGCAAAAARTVTEQFLLDDLQTHFLAGPNAKIPMVFRVQRLSSGRRFAVRVVTLEQKGKAMMTATVSFVSTAAKLQPAMKHSVSRNAKQTVEEITIDDLKPAASPFGPFMQFQRLPVVVNGTVQEPHSAIAPCVAKISSIIKSSPGTLAHALGIVNLSDYHVLDAPLTLSAISFGIPKIGDATRQPTTNHVQFYTSLNHSIHFHVHDGFRADDLTYIEVTSPWAKDGRAMLNSRMFSKDGVLIATCSQEAYYMFKEGAESSIRGKI